MKIKVINKSNNSLPEYQTSGSAGLDILANNDHPITIKPLERVLVKTGLFLEIPQGYEAQVRPRSGLALKNGITVLNSPGTIDSDYRGEVGVILINLSNELFTIQQGDRVAQLVFNKVENIFWEEVLEIEESIRGQGGFGHTGKK